MVYTILRLLTISLGGSLLDVVAINHEILKPFRILAGSLLVFTTSNRFVTDSKVIAYGNDIAACMNAAFKF